ncbi:hypothetical protein MRB53_034234 [Persea americana]|uniref:Uncharacterized protein n=1 Tax=Persea americana TaxID=3435 RepID=A0ACC2KWV6_PERAE|nr:hypothetical protein MRB53_034234 [Persea americana]
MANSKLVFSLLFLALYGMILFGEVQRGVEAKICPQYCLEVDYMTCDSQGNEKLKPVCNCCFAPANNCILHLKDGSSHYCS